MFVRHVCSILCLVIIFCSTGGHGTQDLAVACLGKAGSLILWSTSPVPSPHASRPASFASATWICLPGGQLDLPVPWESWNRSWNMRCSESIPKLLSGMKTWETRLLPCWRNFQNAWARWLLVGYLPFAFSSVVGHVQRVIIIIIMYYIIYYMIIL